MVYLPLVLNLIPTLAIGYLIVIPQSCIAGVNALTIGFAMANLGFVLSYVGGIQLAQRMSARHA
jgi:recombinational DNA repair protein RecT